MHLLIFRPQLNYLFRHAKIEHLNGIEAFVRSLLNQQQQQNPQFMQQSQPQQPIVDAVSAVLISESQPVNQHIPSTYHQSSSVQSSWSNNASPWAAQQDVKPSMNHLGSPQSALPPHHNTPHHSSYGPSPTNTFSSPASNYSGSTNSFNNRPSPYPISAHPHHMKYTNTGTMQQHHQQQQQSMQQQYQQNAYNMAQPQMHSIQQQPQNHMNVYGSNTVMNGYGNDMQQSSQAMDMSGSGMMASNDYSGLHFLFLLNDSINF